jgi:hypothetical protein
LALDAALHALPRFITVVGLVDQGPMRRLLVTISIAALMGTGIAPAWSQETTSGPTAHPMPIVQGQTTVPSGGITSGGAATEATAPPTSPPPPAPLPAGPPAGQQQAEFLSNPAMITGAVAATAIIVCALTCFSHSSGTTTSTTIQHR